MCSTLDVRRTANGVRERTTTRPKQQTKGTQMKNTAFNTRNNINCSADGEPRTMRPVEQSEHSPLPDWWKEGLHGFNERQFNYIVQACNEYPKLKAILMRISDSYTREDQHGLECAIADAENLIINATT